MFLGSVAELLDEYLESPHLKAPIAQLGLVFELARTALSRLRVMAARAADVARIVPRRRR